MEQPPTHWGRNRVGMSAILSITACAFEFPWLAILGYMLWLLSGDREAPWAVALLFWLMALMPVVLAIFFGARAAFSTKGRLSSIGGMIGLCGGIAFCIYFIYGLLEYLWRKN